MVETEAATLRYSFGWSAPEHRRMYRALRRYSRMGFVLGLFNVVAVALLIVILAGMLANAFEGHVDVAIGVLPTFGVVLAWILFFRYGTPSIAVRRHTKNHGGLQWLSVDSKGVSGGCDRCNHEMAWGAFRKAVETKRLYLLYYSPSCAVYLPKKAFENADQENEFRALVGKEMSGKTYFKDES
jgi:hypothetical protein